MKYRFSFLFTCIAALLFILPAAPSFAVVAFRSAASAGSASGTTANITAVNGNLNQRTNCGNITPSIPAGNVGDLLVAQVVAREDDANVSMAGWNTLYSDNVAGENYQVFLFYRSATNTAADTNTITQSGTCDLMMARITRFGNIDTAQPLEPTAGNAVYSDANNVDTGTQDTTVANSMLVLATFVADNRNVTQPGAFTELYDDDNTNADEAGMSLSYLIQATTGTQGPFTNMRLSGGGSDPNHGVLFAVRPSTANNLTINVPAGTASGDVMLASIAVRPGAVPITAPAGWTLIRQVLQNTGNTNVLETYYRVAGGSEPASYTWYFGASHTGAVGGISTYTGVDTTAPIDAEAGAATATGLNHDAPDISTTMDGGMLVTTHTFTSAATWSPPAGMTEAVDVASQGTPNAVGISMEINYEERPLSGATGTRTATAASDADAGATQSVALRSRELICNTTLSSGLPGSYFNNMTLSGSATGFRVDGPVDFNWGTGAPGVTGIGTDLFSVSWDGIVRATVTGNYQFQTVSDDGVRLWVNNTLVIDNWTDHAAATNTSGNVALTAGELNSIHLEFYENGGQAEIRLRWLQPGDVSFTAIPTGPLPGLDAGLYYCTTALPTLSAHYQMDETAWNGSAGEVEDASGNGMDGTATGGATTAGTTPAKSGDPGTCRYGEFDGVDDYVQVNNLSTILNGTASLAFWIRTTQTGSDTGWQAPGVSGVELSGGGDDIFWGWLDANGNIGLSVGNDYTTKSTVPINDGTWRHIVLTRDHNAGEYKIYIDGVLNNSGAIAGGLIGTPFSSIGRIEDTGGTPVYFSGELDEVRIYDSVLDDAQVVTVMNTTHPCTAAPDHIRIEHDGEGLTCAPEEVTVRACLDAACTTEYTDSVTTTLSPAGWVGGDTITFSGGSTTAELRHTTVGAVTLDATSTSPTPGGATRCFNGMTETCTLNFVDSGFIFDVPTQTACKTSADVTITAVKSTDNGQTCAPAFSGNRSVGFWSTYVDPSTGTQAISVNGAPVGTASPGTGINLNFDANAQATFTVTYPDAGLMQLNARLEGSGAEAGLVMTGNDQFVSTPVGLAVYAAANCPAGNAGCPVFGIAGTAFPLNIKAACWVADGDTDLSDNPETPNFRLTGIPMTHTLVSPAGGASGTLGNNAFDFTAADNGISTVNQSVSEVGVFTFTATPPVNGYFGETIPAATSPNIGRFRPDRYAVTFSDILPACISAPPGFTYSRQPFSGSMTIEAQNSTGNLTTNYRDDFATLDPATELDFINDQTGATYDNEAVDFLPGQDFSDVPTGTASLSLQFTWDMPLQANTDSTVQLTASTDEVNNVAGAPVDIGVSNIRFGRVFLENTFGSELLPLTLPFYAEYYDGAQFIRNTDDSCTDYAFTGLTFANRQGLSAGQPTATGNGTLIQGADNPANRILLNSNGEVGSVDATLNVPAYLRFDWDSDGNHDDNPSAKATFGIFDGSQRQIYIREVY